MAEAEPGPIFVPFTLPGECVTADVDGGRARLVDIVTASAERVSPPCPHFGVCGGCALQHMAAQPYRDWKRDQVAAAFAARGIEASVTETVACAGPRRRAALSAIKSPHGVRLGFHRHASHDLVDLETCSVLDPVIVKALPRLRDIAAPLSSRRGEIRIVVTSTRHGLDVAFDGVTAALDMAVRAKLAALAQDGVIARVSVNGDPLLSGRPAVLEFGRTEVEPPPGAFVQAVAEMEAIMAALILEAAGKSKSVADLFCGAGAFTFRIAERARVLAVDSSKVAIAALANAARFAKGVKPIEARARDLFREPLSATELRDFDCVVFDPPRAGAEAQARMLSKSKVKTIVAVSCHPATLARDARILIDGGYALEGVTPVDQFLYSAHIEAVAVFRR